MVPTHHPPEPPTGLDYVEFDTLPTPARRTSLPPVSSANDKRLPTDSGARWLSVLLWLFPLALLAIALTQVDTGPEGPDPAIEAQRATDLATCKRNAQYLDARRVLHVDPWATDRCMERLGWELEDADQAG